MSQPNWTSLRKRADFLRLQNQGQKWVTPAFVIHAQAHADLLKPLEIGFTATRKLGGAVIRNRAKRRLRALCDAVFTTNAVLPYQISLFVRSDALTREFKDLVRDLRWALRKLGVLTEQKP